GRAADPGSDRLPGASRAARQARPGGGGGRRERRRPPAAPCRRARSGRGRARAAAVDRAPRARGHRARPAHGPPAGSRAVPGRRAAPGGRGRPHAGASPGRRAARPRGRSAAGRGAGAVVPSRRPGRDRAAAGRGRAGARALLHQADDPQPAHALGILQRCGRHELQLAAAARAGGGARLRRLARGLSSDPPRPLAALLGPARRAPAGVPRAAALAQNERRGPRALGEL
ncbi:MAG: Putative predicted metal-dependent hydrolase, partial [uncultured Solirubrobacteraceae bacterium]